MRKRQGRLYCFLYTKAGQDAGSRCGHPCRAQTVQDVREGRKAAHRQEKAKGHEGGDATVNSIGEHINVTCAFNA